MRLIRSLAFSLISLNVSSAIAASWGFSDATLSVQAKGAGVGGGIREK